MTILEKFYEKVDLTTDEMITLMASDKLTHENRLELSSLLQKQVNREMNVKAKASPSKSSIKDEITEVALSSTPFGAELAAKANEAGVMASTIRGVWDSNKGFVVTKVNHHTKITEAVSMSPETANKKRKEQAGFGGRSGILCQDGVWRRAVRKRGKTPVYLYWEWKDGEQPGQPAQENIRK